uniref:Ubiquitin-conjugating enzyme family protein n=1 Tax=Kwoniella dejecticola CBS 10117 TaxID=1296121 RepID=A0A1A5ZX20_9TREE|nr:uncharacterized protein I303_07108 [Kwoniella dejecticola CBS 10117]OBR82349.1 hypothetical protein I303_07108 [Kwoniella dejecticola CBS 10117]
MSDPALSQLLDMGIPGGRARAALKRSKGDVMSAAERVFAGEFDDVPSDDEEEEAESSSKGRGEENGVILVDDSDEEMADGSDGDESDGNDFDGFEDDGEIPEDRLLSDPYAGIFFSKERVEAVVEPIEEPKYVRSFMVKGERENVRVLGRGEWMSGCPEGNEQSFLFQLYSMLAEGRLPCSGGCGHEFVRNEDDFFLLFSDFSAYTAYLKGKTRATCPLCRQITCLACGDKINADGGLTPQNNGKAPNLPVEKILLHCPNVQGVLLGVGLHMIEQAFSSGGESRSQVKNMSGKSSVRAPPEKKQKTSADRLSLTISKTSREESDDVVSTSSKGIGYDGSSSDDRSGQKKAEEAQIAADSKTVILLAEVQTYLPNLNRPGGARTSDHLVHPTALAHLRRRSGFVNDLLRNDSLLDMSKREGLYTSLFDWLQIVSNHEALASMLAMPQMRPVSVSPCPDDLQSHIVTYEGTSSPRELLENCVIQAQAALKGLQSVSELSKTNEIHMTEEDKRVSKAELARRERVKQEEEKSDANFQLRSFCERIIASAQAIDRSLVETKGKAFVDRMRESLPKLPDSSIAVEDHALSAQGTEATIKIYEEWAGRARFQYCDLTEPSSSDKKGYRHAYSGSIQSLEGMDMPRRSLAIAKELAILTTSLPVAWHSTIFLQVDETRVDVLKAMIIGPEGTPYENGCFIFDIFLPLDYNQRCPNVKSMTTNGGTYRLNPNLYADGKVCLSLLGTWSGPGWISGQSTLLQVLISIQSLILCEEPYTNEPGKFDQSRNKAYSANVRRMVLVDAMANNIKRPPYPFETEIKAHFRLKAKSIKEQIEKWKKLDDGKAVSGDSFLGAPGHTGTITFDGAAQEVKRLLGQLENGESIAGTNEKAAAKLTAADLASSSTSGIKGDVVGGGSKLAKVLGLKKK